MKSKKSKSQSPMKFPIALKAKEYFNQVAKLSEKEKRLKEILEIQRDLSHDIKSLNTRIKDTAKKIQDSISGQEYYNLDKYSKTIAGLCFLSNSRMDLFQFLLSPDEFIAFSNEKIHIYRVINKIHKSIEESEFETASSIRLIGESHKYFRAKRILSIGFYILIENSIKYSCKEKAITIDFKEFSNTITVTFSNWGPIIQDDEKAHLTERGFRSNSAKQKEPNRGQGLGLSIAQDIFNICGVPFIIEFGDKIFERPSDKIQYQKFKVTLTFTPTFE